MNEEVAHEKILRYNNVLVARAGRHLDRVQLKWFQRTKCL